MVSIFRDVCGVSLYVCLCVERPAPCSLCEYVCLCVEVPLCFFCRPRSLFLCARASSVGSLRRLPFLRLRFLRSGGRVRRLVGWAVE